MTATLPRSKVKQDQTWNAESVFKSPAEFEAEVESILASLDSLKKFQGHLGDSPDTFVEAMTALDVLSQRSARMRVSTRAAGPTRRDPILCPVFPPVRTMSPWRPRAGSTSHLHP